MRSIKWLLSIATLVLLVSSCTLPPEDGFSRSPSKHSTDRSLVDAVIDEVVSLRAAYRHTQRAVI